MKGIGLFSFFFIQLLWKEIFGRTISVPVFSSITLEKLINDNIQSYSSTLYKIIQIAKYEYKLKKEIAKVEDRISNLHLSFESIPILEDYCLIMKNAKSIYHVIEEMRGIMYFFCLTKPFIEFDIRNK